ncbi:hypothetical protein PtrEW7m1_006957 [Pyrenophora tritici-repentis]|nr:hypothetical protein PtrEW7m1_006957 [Pyrenophora tritici-repentis]PWO24201.1 splicing factor 3a [Pyrenophora tritici-repentis]
MATIGMTSTASRKFNWADDDEDDFDLDTWKASADTSAPKAEEMGPLHFSDSSSDLSSSDFSSSDDDETDNEEEQEKVEMPQSTLYSRFPILFYDLPTQLAHAHSKLVCNAVGPYMDGKEDCDPPAYPELNYDHTCKRRYSYAHEFQEERLLWHRDLATVYRESHLVIATHIDDAETIDESVSMKIKSHNGEELDEWETIQIQMFEAEEEKEEKDVQIKVQRMMDEQTKDPDSVFRGRSKEDLEEFYRGWKAQQAKLTKQAVDDEADEDNSDDSSVQSWENSDEENDLSETILAVEEDSYHHSYTTTPSNLDEEKENILSITPPMSRVGSITTSTYTDDNEDDVELNFNEVIFGTEDEPVHEDELIAEDAASCHSSDSANSWTTDEGYSSPGNHDLTSGNTASKVESFMAIFQPRFSDSSARRKTQACSGSMNAIRVFKDTVQNSDVVEEAFKSDSESEENEVEAATSPARQPLAAKDAMVPNTTSESSSSPPADEGKAREVQDTTFHTLRGVPAVDFSLPDIVFTTTEGPHEALFTLPSSSSLPTHHIGTPSSIKSTSSPPTETTPLLQ